MKIDKKLFSLLALTISVAYLYKQIDLHELSMAIERASPKYLLIALFLSTLTVLISTLRWYIFLKEVQRTSFKKTLFAFISGYYLISVLPPSIGHIAKVKLVGGDYFKALSTLIIGLSTELLVVLSFALIFIGLTKVGILMMIVVIFALVYEQGIYRAVNSLLGIWENIGLRGLVSSLRGYAESLYHGWSKAKENKKLFSSSFFLSLIIILLQVYGIIVVGKAFGLQISIKQALTGFIMSVLFAGISGIPSGVGANEFGLVLGIGASTTSTITAFTYKLLFQYLYSIIGAIVFYSSFGGSKSENSVS